MEQSKWEAICRQCGQCCHEKIQYEDGSIFFTDTPCVYLGPDKKCTIYADRRKIYPGCIQLTPIVVATTPLLPGDCEYIKWLKMRR